MEPEKYAYLVYSLLFLIIWSILYHHRYDLRKKMFRFSLLTMPLGSISNIWFLQDYWKRETILGYPISIEDAIFSFAVGGITFALPLALMKLNISTKNTHKSKPQIAIIAPIITLGLLIILTSNMGVNSIYSSSLAFIIIALLIWYFRPDLIKPSIFSGIYLVIVFLGIYQIMNVIFQGDYQDWCLDCNPSNISFMGVNFEELLWDFSWGLVGGVIYASVKGKSYETRNPQSKTDDISFVKFDKELNITEIGKQNSKLGVYLESSTSQVLLIRIPRYIKFKIKKILHLDVSYLLLSIILGFTPLIIYFLFILFKKAILTTPALIWAACYTILLILLFEFPKSAWFSVIKLSDTVSQMLTNNNEENKLIAWFSNALNLKSQIILSLIGGVISTLSLRVVKPFLSGIVIFEFSTAISIFFVGFIGTNAVYWLIRTPFFIKHLSEFNLNIIKFGPSYTNGIKSLASLTSTSALKAALGMSIFILPLIWIEISHNTELPFFLFSFLPYSISLLAVFFIAIIPQYWLSTIMLKEKNSVLEKISLDLEKEYIDKTKKPNWGELPQKLELYKFLEKSKINTFEFTDIIKSIIAFLGALFPAFLDYLF